MHFASSCPPLVTEEGGMTNSQIGQAFGNDVLDRSRPCREPHVHSSKVAVGCIYGIDLFIEFSALITNYLTSILAIDFLD